MRNLAISLLLLGAATLQAQPKNAIEIKKIGDHGQTLSDAKIIAADGNRQFLLHANEEANVDLTFFLKTDGDLSVQVKSKNEKVIFTQKFTRKDANKMSFTMEENAEYIVSLSSAANTQFTIRADENL